MANKITVYLGNKNYSSWSLRAWLPLKRTGAPFTEHVFRLGEPGVREKIRAVSPAGKVPALHHGEIRIWDSLAIGEYLAERFPAAGLWPEDPAPRAVARSVVAEMHSGFPALRTHMPMNVRRSSPGKGRAEGVQEDIDRIVALWRDCRDRFGKHAGGEFLFGPFGLADCFFAPVVSRFRTYAVDLPQNSVERAYADAVWNTPEMQEWRTAAANEKAVEPKYDV